MIKEAIRRLDKENPKWDYFVDTETLDNNSGTKDILGQVFGKSFTGQSLLGLSQNDRELLGFDGYEEEWKSVIRLKQEERGPVAHQPSLFD